MLPSVNQLCEEAKLSRDTVFKAYAILKDSNRVVAVPNKGYYVANEKDLFSTLNQGSGTFVFNNWLMEIKKISDMKFTFQVHDEICVIFPTKDLNKNKPLFQQAMERVNQRLKMNVNFSVSVDIGHNYAECH